MSPGEPPMVCLAVVNGYSTYTEYIELTCTVFMLFIHKLQISFTFTEFLFGLSEISDLRSSDYRGYNVSQCKILSFD